MGFPEGWDTRTSTQKKRGNFCVVALLYEAYTILRALQTLSLKPSNNHMKYILSSCLLGAFLQTGALISLSTQFSLSGWEIWVWGGGKHRGLGLPPIREVKQFRVVAKPGWGKKALVETESTDGRVQWMHTKVRRGHTCDNPFPLLLATPSPNKSYLKHTSWTLGLRSNSTASMIVTVTLISRLKTRISVSIYPYSLPLLCTNNSP